MVSELRKHERADPRVLRWFEDIADGEIHLSVLVGVETIRKCDGIQAASLERWLTRMVAAHAERIVPVDGRVAEEWGRLLDPFVARSPKS